MTDVLMIAGSTPKPTVVAAAVDRFRQLGARVHLVGNFKAADIDADLGWATVRKVPAGGSASKHVQRKTDAMRFPERLWFHLEHDRAARAVVRSADLVVALDHRAVYSAWRISQFRRQPDVCFGIAAGLRALEKRLETGAVQPEHVPGPLTVATDGLRRRVRTLPADLLRNATGPLALRSRVGARAWRAAVSAPGVPDSLRMTATEQVIEGMWLAGRQSGAIVTARAAADRLADPAIKAELLDNVASRVIRNGRTPANLTDAVTAYLDLADQRHAAGDLAAAADALLHATKLAFHRVVHIDQV
ncbi:glycosyltransferase family 1 protein, partial [Streptomyces anulatus]